MSSNPKKAMERQLETMFADMGKFIKVLAEDYRFSRHILQKDPKNQMFRRMAVRNFCAEVEGVIHAFKWNVLLCYKALEVNLANTEVAALREESYDLSNSGEATPKPQYFPFSKNFKFGCKMFIRVFQCSYLIDYRGEGWPAVQQVFDVRNRLMHPKLLKGIEVSDAEVEVLMKASAWLQEVMPGLVNSCDFVKVAESAKSNRSSELN
jgi:hypothetical protein